jgi:general secretion pathway protein L
MRDRPLTIDLSAPARLSDVPSLVSGFLGWWRDELLAMFPGARASAVEREQATLYLQRDRWLLKTSRLRDAVSLDNRATDTELADQMLDAADGASLSRLRVVLPREHVLMRNLELPALSATHLRQAVELQIDRLSPFKSDAVRYAAHVTGRDADRGLLHVGVAIVPQLRIRPIEQRLRSLGFAATAIDVEGESGEALGFDLREPVSPEDRSRRRKLNLALAFGTVLVWALAIYAWSDAGAREAAAWQARIAELSPAAQRSAAMRLSIGSLSAPVAEANEHDPAAMLDTLDALTKVLPDTARIVDLSIDGNDIRISGLAASAPELIGLLERSPRFAGVKPASPFVRKSDGTAERFEITMRIEGRAP